jgi:hypothetical protein
LISIFKKREKKKELGQGLRAEIKIKDRNWDRYRGQVSGLGSKLRIGIAIGIKIKDTDRNRGLRLRTGIGTRIKIEDKDGD